MMVTTVAHLDCPECGQPMVLRRSKRGPFYGCSAWPQCDGSHGAHPDGRPLGIPADKKTKQARIVAHAAFDRLWKSFGERRRRSTARTRAYRWLESEMKLSTDDCHIARFTRAQCEEVVRLVHARLDRNSHSEEK